MSILLELQNQFPQIEWQERVVLAPFTYMKVGGPAEIFWKAQDRELLEAVVVWLRQTKPDVNLTLLGGASNVVVADAGIDGVVIVNECSQAGRVEWSSLEEEAKKAATGFVAQKNVSYFLSETGIKTAILVRHSIDAGLEGLEPFLGVPGTLGGAIFNNAHYTHELIGSFVAAVRVVSKEGIQWLSHNECEFAYDASRFQRTGEVITQVLFALPEGNAESSLARIREATLRRSSTQPLGTANSGCLFKNAHLTPEQQLQYDGKETLSAGWLIDQAGLKGERVGGAVVSSKHANFLVNDTQASSADVEALAKKVENTVKEKFGITLEREVFFIGKWEE